MRTRAVCLLLVPLSVLAACAAGTPSPSPSPSPAVGSVANVLQQSDSPLTGTWELVSSRVSRGDSVIADLRAPELRSLKVLDGTHFSFITVRRDTQFVRAAAGRYTTTRLTATEGRYTEMVELSSTRGMRGATYEFSYRVEGDMWYHAGGAGATKFDEVWRRVR
jgi:hypothetical protein